MSFHGFEARLLWIELPASWRERRVFDGEFSRRLAECARVDVVCVERSIS